MMTKIYIQAFVIALIVSTFGTHQAIHAQENKSQRSLGDQIYIGYEGVMYWREDQSEVTGFGVNYTVPFAHAYRSGKKLGVDLKAAIDQDVYHFARLGLDLFRVHVWDTEISDTIGNLIDNEHLELFDYLLFKLQERGINAVITPIAYWGNGWPDPDEPTPGFSHKYGKDSCLVDPAAIKAQENYLRQFITHVNRYNGIAYKDDPAILAFEISNEPHHRGTAAEVTSFVKRLKNAIRSTGCTKPVFYNVTHSIHLADAYFDAGIDGGTFQWYPTGLGFRKELGGNMLPNVDRYEIPFDNIANNVLGSNNAARFVYEFDAADMASSYMYPAMARSFRSAGMQLATHFSYDPTFLAPYNTEYNTHFMNLVYAPQKALSLMICGEVFRNIPLHTDYGVYPDNISFGPFRVSYEENLAEMVTEEKFIYTNNTSTKINNPENLLLIAGYGNSTLVEYEGTGAYFLDKMGDGIWRLELMPDAVIVDNLFGWNSLDSTRAVIKYERRNMKFNLPEFQYGYLVQSLDWRDSIIYREVEKEFVGLVPGVYLLMAPEYDQLDSVMLQSRKKIELMEYFAPPSNSNSTYSVYHSKRIPEKKGDKAIILFDAQHHFEWLNRQWVPGYEFKPASASSPAHLSLTLNGLRKWDVENPDAAPIADYTIRHYFGDLIEGRKNDLSKVKYLRLKGRIEGYNAFPIQISLVMKDGSAFGGSILPSPASEAGNYSIDINDLKKVRAVLLPRPYPTFLPYFSVAGKAEQLDITQIESLQISIGPGIDEEDWGKTFQLSISKVWLE